jgi:hypothetical protein
MRDEGRRQKAEGGKRKQRLKFVPDCADRMTAHASRVTRSILVAPLLSMFVQAKRFMLQ